KGFNLASEVDAADAGHDDIGQKKMNGPAVVGSGLQGLGAIAGTDDGVAGHFEKFLGDLAEGVEVLNEENRFSGGRGCERLFLDLWSGRGVVNAREVKLEGGATAGFAVDPDVPAALLDDAVDHGQAEA